MGAVHSGNSFDHLPLAEKRYRVDPSNLRRSAKRKIGGMSLQASTVAQTQRDEQNPIDEATDNQHLQFEIPSISAAPDFDAACANTEVPQDDKIANNEKHSRLISLKRNQTITEINCELRPLIHTNNASILLTKAQRIHIENSWKQIKKGSETIGYRIFYSILAAQPSIKYLFLALFGMEKLPLGRLKYDNRSRKHAAVLTRTMEYIVVNQTYTEKLSQHFRTLGKRHCQLQQSCKAFPSEYWETFKECFIKCVTDGVSSFENRQDSERSSFRETTVAWRILITFIISEMRKGFDEERLGRKRFKTMDSRLSLARLEQISFSEDNVREFKGWDFPNAHTKRLDRFTRSKNDVVSGTGSDSNRLSVSNANSDRSASWCEAMSSTNETLQVNMKGLNLGSSSRVKSECTIPKGSLTLIDSMGTTFRGISEPVFHRTTHSDLDVCTAEESVKEYYEYELVLEEPSLHHSHRYSFPTSKVNDISLKNMETRTTE